jgi:hypothetical protein
MNRVLFCALLTLGWTLSNCNWKPFATEPEATTGAQQRDPAVAASARKYARVIPIPKDLEQSTEQFLNYIESASFQPNNCSEFLNEVYESVYKIDALYFDKARAIARADQILRNLWLAKLALRQRLGEFLNQERLQPPCVNAARHVLRAGRFLEDYVGNLKLNPSPSDPKKLPLAFSGAAPSLMLNPKYSKLEYRSGDVLLSRGTAFTSAAIARVGDIDAQFSHLTILYIDPKTKQAYTTEAHIEIGSRTFKWQEYIGDGKARAVLFRHPDAKLAHESARQIFLKATAATAKGANIPYDFAMNAKDSSELFCAEVVSHAFQLGSQSGSSQLSLPLYMTELKMRNRDFLNAIGVVTNETFAPADMETDPRFELVAEWRDFARVDLLHHHDAILTSMYDWMERYDYKLKTDLDVFLKKNALWTLRRWPLFSSLLKDKFPTNMSRETLGAVFNLNEVAEKLMEFLQKEDAAYRQQNGLPMSFYTLLQKLEDFRKQDLREYQQHLINQASGPQSQGQGIAAGQFANPGFHFRFRGPESKK